MVLRVVKRWLRFFQALSQPELSNSILPYLDCGVVVINPKGIATLVNSAAAELMNAEVGAMQGKHVQQFLPPSLVTPLLDTLLTQQPCRHNEITLHLASNRILTVDYRTAPLYAKSGRVSGAFLMLYDLSHVIKSEAEKRRTERLASIGAFVSGVAHEIKNPLVAIKTLAELLPEQYDDEEFRHTFPQLALYEIDRIDALVKRLRSLGSVPPSRPRRMSILEPLHETLALLSGELTRCGITLEYDNRVIPPAVIGDPDQLKQVFLNLCLNSIEAMQDGGILRVSLSSEMAQEADSGCVLIHISDTGPGLPLAEMNRLFDPFVTTKAHGSGLGLAICKAIMEHHKGTIHARNCGHGSGAQFIVRLPVDHKEDTYEVVTPRRRPARTADPVA